MATRRPPAATRAGDPAIRSTGSRSARGSWAGFRYFLFRKVPGDVNWFQTLGSATLTAFIVQAVTGVILAMYYKPDPVHAYTSIQHVANDVWAGWLVRGMHRWGASAFIILMFLHMGRVFLFGAYKYPRELNWIIGVLLLTLSLAEGFTGYLLPWDQTAYWATTVGININANGAVPRAVHRAVPAGRRGDQRRHAQPLLRDPHARAARRRSSRLIGLHMYLVVRLGVTSPPWSKDAAGTGPKDAAAVGERRPRGPHRASPLFSTDGRDDGA